MTNGPPLTTGPAHARGCAVSPAAPPRYPRMSIGVRPGVSTHGVAAEVGALICVLVRPVAGYAAAISITAVLSSSSPRRDATFQGAKSTMVFRSAFRSFGTRAPRTDVEPRHARSDRDSRVPRPRVLRSRAAGSSGASSRSHRGTIHRRSGSRAREGRHRAARDTHRGTRSCVPPPWSSATSPD
jgi:hypothetical protein